MYVAKVNEEKLVYVFRGRNNGCDPGMKHEV